MLNDTTFLVCWCQEDSAFSREPWKPLILVGILPFTNWWCNQRGNYNTIFFLDITITKLPQLPQLPHPSWAENHFSRKLQNYPITPITNTIFFFFDNTITKLPQLPQLQHQSWAEHNFRTKLQNYPNYPNYPNYHTHHGLKIIFVQLQNYPNYPNY